MKKIIIISSLLAIALIIFAMVGCGDSQSQKPPGMISGNIKYTGSRTGDIVAYISEQPQGTSQPVSLKADDFKWPLSGTWYIWAYFGEGIINGPSPQSNELLVKCNPITVKDGEGVSATVVITDSDVYGNSKSCN